ncbi:MAG: class I SAM-dependent methyltransferase [Cyanobacteriota bacterium]|nr:class I SAM-dependent methyltransferase [Cyanobacteriota bacterium]
MAVDQPSAAPFWDQRYGEAEPAYGLEPNDFLKQQAANLPAGDAICLAEGQGRNAVHLARLGHRVVAQDLSSVGLARAVALAASHKVKLRTQQGDLADWDPAPQSVDLVVAIWMHLPPRLRAQVHRKAIEALRPGGHLLIEAYTPAQLALATGGPPSLELLVDPGDLRQELQGLELLVFQSCERWIEEGPYHHGQSAVVQALAQKVDR